MGNRAQAWMMKRMMHTISCYDWLKPLLVGRDDVSAGVNGYRSLCGKVWMGEISADSLADATFAMGTG
eukprot:2568244-Pleurochrysis_carterae.AAC.4